jgi:diguanylate cyclase (GGDEF)-like protein
LTYTLVTDLLRQGHELRNVRAALAQIDYGILLLDQDFRAEFMNGKVCELGGLSEPVPGEKPAFADLIRRIADNDIYAISDDEREAYIAGRHAWVRQDDPPPFDIRRRDGRITRVKCIVLRDGARMLTYTDETETVRHVHELEELASHDGLTGVYNRRQFQTLAQTEWTRSRRYDRPMSMLMIDIDFFKRINDRFGHDVGDEVLRSIAQLCRDAKRDSDLLARIGGEEFAMLLPETDLVSATAIADRLCAATRSGTFVASDPSYSVALSIGVASLEAGVDTLDQLAKRADQALYAAKRAGRNRVAAAPAEPQRLRAA